MRIENNFNTSYAHDFQTQNYQALNNKEPPTPPKRQTYGTILLEKLDDKAYKAFINATSQLSKEDKALAARELQRVAAISAANEYATINNIDLLNDLTTVYNFFANYHQAISSDQIKQLLNDRLQIDISTKSKTFNSRQFFQDYIAQLGINRILDIRI